MSKALSLPPSRIGPKAQHARVQTAIAVRRNGSSIDWDGIAKAVETLARGRLLPQGMTPEQAVVACAKGAELGIPPMQAIGTIPVINGRPTLEAKLMLALAYRRLPSFDYRVEKWTREGCTLVGRRSPAHSETRVTFDSDDAKAASLLGKGPWKAHPKAMFFARASAMLVRAVAPDVFAGLYTPDEAEFGAAPDADDTPLQAVVVDEDEHAEAEVVPVEATASAPPEDDNTLDDEPAKTFDRAKAIAFLDARDMKGTTRTHAHRLGFAGRLLRDLKNDEMARLYDSVNAEIDGAVVGGNAPDRDDENPL